MKKREREMDEGPCKNKKISHVQKNIRRKRQNHGTSYSLTFHSIHHISTHMHFSIMVV
jgi:hypothetical protein